MPDVVSLGEIMIQLNPLQRGPLRFVKLFEKYVAGTEGNFIVGMARLGFTTGFITRVGNDEFGLSIVDTLRSEGVDVSYVKVDDKAPTGVYFIQRNYPIPGKTAVFYYRKGSAASKLSREDIDVDYIGNAKLLHLTGITPALSESCRETVYYVHDIARSRGVEVSFDTNIRVKLWSGDEEIRQTLTRLLASDYVFTSPEDLQVLIPNLAPIDAASKMVERGVKIVVFKLGGEGALAIRRGGKAKKEAFKVPIEDELGAGDAFDAAFMASYLKGFSLEECLEYANAAGALTVTMRGDLEPLPRWRDLEVFIDSQRGKKIRLR